MDKKQHVAVALMLLAFAMSLHQFVTWGRWFEMKDALHHETFIIALFFASVVVMFVGRRRKKSG